MRPWDEVHAEIIGVGLLAEYELDAVVRRWHDWLFVRFWGRVVPWPPFQMTWPRWEVSEPGSWRLPVPQIPRVFDGRPLRHADNPLIPGVDCWVAPHRPVLEHINNVTAARINTERAMTLVDLFKYRSDLRRSWDAMLRERVRPSRHVSFHDVAADVIPDADLTITYRRPGSSGAAPESPIS